MRTLVLNSTKPTNQFKEKSLIVSKLSNIINNIGFGREKGKDFTISDHIFYLLKAAETLAPQEKSKIENHIVKMGELAVPHLVKSLTKNFGASRGLAAMALIRIGEPSISFLDETLAIEPEFGWVAEYIINEIRGTQVKLTEVPIANEFERVLVG
jgi:hypothetical protein